MALSELQGPVTGTSRSICEVHPELNAETVEVEIDYVAQGGLDPEKFEREEAIQALSVLDGVVLH